MAVLRRTERGMVRAMCGAKLMEKTRTEDLMEMFLEQVKALNSVSGFH